MSIWISKNLRLFSISGVYYYERLNSPKRRVLIIEEKQTLPTNNGFVEKQAGSGASKSCTIGNESIHCL
jgi:hypothetical protein